MPEFCAWSTARPRNSCISAPDRLQDRHAEVTRVTFPKRETRSTSRNPGEARRVRPDLVRPTWCNAGAQSLLCSIRSAQLGGTLVRRACSAPGFSARDLPGSPYAEAG